MTVDDRTRLNLHRKLGAVLRPEEADTLMSHLPPVTWSDVATKADVDTIRTEMRALDAGLRGAVADAVATQTKWMTTVVLAWSAVLLTAVRFLP